MSLSDHHMAALQANLDRIQASLDQIRGLLPEAQATDEVAKLDPKSPRNKNGQFLTHRGIEVCYRLFDLGLSRYAVSEALDISFGAATHRMHAWEKAGGANRSKALLND